MPPPAIGEVWKAFMAFFAGLFQRLTVSFIYSYLASALISY
jgi:hypothetical protein